MSTSGQVKMLSNKNQSQLSISILLPVERLPAGLKACIYPCGLFSRIANAVTRGKICKFDRFTRQAHIVSSANIICFGEQLESLQSVTFWPTSSSVAAAVTAAS